MPVRWCSTHRGVEAGLAELRGIEADGLGEVEPPPPRRLSPRAVVASGLTDGLDCRGVRQAQGCLGPLEIVVRTFGS
jgi:hypothetical protein